MITKNSITWDEVFNTGKIDYPNTHEGTGAAIATGLCGWANCMMGNKPPENFGNGMVALGQFLAISPTADGFKEAADKWEGV